MVNPGAGHWGWGTGHQSIPASAGEMGEAADRALPPPCVAAGATGNTDRPELGALQDPEQLSKCLNNPLRMDLPTRSAGFPSCCKHKHEEMLQPSDLLWTHSDRFTFFLC